MSYVQFSVISRNVRNYFPSRMVVHQMRASLPLWSSIITFSMYVPCHNNSVIYVFLLRSMWTSAFACRVCVLYSLPISFSRHIFTCVFNSFLAFLFVWVQTCTICIWVYSHLNCTEQRDRTLCLSTTCIVSFTLEPPLLKSALPSYN